MASVLAHRRGIYHTCLVALAAMTFPATAEGATSDASAEVGEIDALALENNESIHAFDARIRQAQSEAESYERQWPEPTLEYMLDISAPWTSHFSTGHSIQLMQAIPRGGAREAQGAPARAASRVELSRQDAATLELLRDLRLDMVALARLAARIELLDEERQLIEDAIGVVEQIAPLGEADHGDFFQLELARETVVDELARLRSERESRQAAMAARMGVDTARVEQMAFPADVLDEWLVELPPTERLVELARENEPLLATLDAEASVAAARVDLVDERRRPMPRLMAGYSNMPPMWEMDGPRNQMLQFGIAFELPLFGSQYDAEASQWQAAQKAIEQDRTQQTTEIRGRVEELLSGWNTDRERLRRHERELAPLAADLAERVLIGMELGERSASEYLLAVQQEVELEGRMIELRAALLERLMEIQRLTGGEIGADQAWAYPMAQGETR